MQELSGMTGSNNLWKWNDEKNVILAWICVQEAQSASRVRGSRALTCGSLNRWRRNPGGREGRLEEDPNRTWGDARAAGGRNGSRARGERELRGTRCIHIQPADCRRIGRRKLGERRRGRKAEETSMDSSQAQKAPSSPSPTGSGKPKRGGKRFPAPRRFSRQKPPAKNSRHFLNDLNVISSGSWLCSLISSAA
jgi:hypothetical protein